MNVTIDHTGTGSLDDHAVVFIISDSLGDSASSVVNSAAAQFSEGSMCVRRLSQIESVDDVRTYFDDHEEDFVETAVVHSIVNPKLRSEVRDELASRGITTIDVLGPIVQLLSGLTGERPKNQASANHKIDSRYIKRVAAMEFFVDHDNGKNPQDLDKADVVLVGLTGSAKTPLAMNLSFRGYAVASVSLDPGTEIPQELYSIDKSKIFGLMTSIESLVEAHKHSSADVRNDSDILSEMEQAQASAASKMDSLECNCLDTSDTTVEELVSIVLSQIEAE